MKGKTIIAGILAGLTATAAMARLVGMEQEAAEGGTSGFGMLPWIGVGVGVLVIVTLAIGFLKNK